MDILSVFSYSEVARQLGYSVNGSSLLKAKKYVQENNLDVSHFSLSAVRVKYPPITKVCPICSKSFLTGKGSPKEKTVCSRGCANSYFRTGENHGNWKEVNQGKESKYRSVCFKHHDKKCIICGEDRIVEVHHYDENHENNVPENLVPICPTHHKYFHSRYRNLVEPSINEYVKLFVGRRCTI